MCAWIVSTPEEFASLKKKVKFTDDIAECGEA